MNRMELLEVLNQLKPCIKKNNLIPHLSLISFKDDTIEVFNGIQGIKADFGIGLSCAVDATDFYKIISSLDKDEIDLVHQDEHLLVKSGRSRYKLDACEPSLYFPIDDNIEFKPIPKDFLEGIRRCLKFASRNIVEEEKYGITVNDSVLYSTNGISLSSYSLQEQTGLKHILPEPFLKIVTGLEGEDILIGADNKSVFAIGDKVKVFTMINEIELLNYDEIIQKYKIDEDKFVEIPQELRNIVERIIVLEGKEIDILSDCSELHLKYEGKGISCKEEIDLKLDRFSSKFDAVLFSRLLDNSQKIGAIVEDNNVVFVGKRGSEFLCLVANIF